VTGAAPSLSAGAPALAGFALGASLIIAIGAQNAFVLRQGLRREHVLAVVSICAAVDAALITVGVAGFGSLIARIPYALDLASLGGAIFLVIMGVRSVRSAFRSEALTPADAETVTVPRLGAVVATTLAVSLLNPHVYLDTVVLLGSVAATYPPDERVAFALGAMTASFAWFFSLGFGARLLAPLFARPVAWRVLDLLIAGIMFWIAATLLIGLLG
jgi:L-lysine exporter family protein LysE/ArgO